MRHPLPQSSSRPACPLSLCQNQQKSRALCAQRRVLEGLGRAMNKKGLWRTALLRGSSWLGGQSQKRVLQSPRGHRVQSQDPPQGCHPPPGTGPAGMHRRLPCLPGRAAKISLV